MSDAAAASTSAPAAGASASTEQKQVKLTSADNEEFNVDQEVVSAAEIVYGSEIRADLVVLLLSRPSDPSSSRTCWRVRISSTWTG